MKEWDSGREPNKGGDLETNKDLSLPPLQRLANELKEEKAQCRKLERDLDALRTRAGESGKRAKVITGLREELQVSKDEVARLQRELEDARSEYKVSEAQAAAALKRVDSQRGESEENRARTSFLVQHNRELKSKIANLESRVWELE